MDLNNQAVELVCSNQAASENNKQPSIKEPPPKHASSIDMDVDYCRICHCAESPTNGLVELISPCYCSGSLRWVHHSCLQRWLDATNTYKCELCKFPFSMSIKYKPLHEWGSLNSSPSERRRLICNSVFNLVSIFCIFWSTYVLIERASMDAKNGNIDWSFYLKVSVVSIGLIVGVVFLLVQMKLYFSMFMKWRQLNRIIIIRNANLPGKKNRSEESKPKSYDDNKNIVPKVATANSTTVSM